MRLLLSHAARILAAVFGVLLVVLGLVLWLTPVVPGLGLVFVGLPMVMAVHPKGKRLALRWKRQVLSRTARWRARWRGRQSLW